MWRTLLLTGSFLSAFVADLPTACAEDQAQRYQDAIEELTPLGTDPLMIITWDHVPDELLPTRCPDVVPISGPACPPGGWGVHPETVEHMKYIFSHYHMMPDIFQLFRLRHDTAWRVTLRATMKAVEARYLTQIADLEAQNEERWRWWEIALLAGGSAVLVGGITLIVGFVAGGGGGTVVVR